MRVLYVYNYKKKYVRDEIRYYKRLYHIIEVEEKTKIIINNDMEKEVINIKFEQYDNSITKINYNEKYIDYVDMEDEEDYRVINYMNMYNIIYVRDERKLMISKKYKKHKENKNEKSLIYIREKDYFEELIKYMDKS